MLSRTSSSSPVVCVHMPSCNIGPVNLTLYLCLSSLAVSLFSAYVFSLTLCQTVSQDVPRVLLRLAVPYVTLVTTSTRLAHDVLILAMGNLVINWTGTSFVHVSNGLCPLRIPITGHCFIFRVVGKVLYV